MKQYNHFFSMPFWLSALLMFLPPANTITYQVTGTLTHNSEAPVAGHHLYLYNAEDERLASDITDDQGRFNLPYQVLVTSADPFGGKDTPSEFELGASYPNPFNPRTTVPFYAPENTRAEIAIYTILGQEVMRTRADLNVGSHEIAINFGGSLSQGQYLLRLVGDGFSLTRPMTFVSAGIGGGTPGITVRSGGGTRSSMATGSHALDVSEMYRIVVEGSAAFAEKQVEVPALQDHDAGTIELTKMEYLLDVTIEGDGTVEEEIITAKEFEHGTVVRLTAVPAEGWRFVEWSGDAEGTSPVVELMIVDEKTVTAIFEPDGEDGDWPRDTETEMVEVTSATGRVWMDRNLGASRAATSSTDSEAYGDLYQWGRAADGHQRRNSPTTDTLSISDWPGHGRFILSTFEVNWDWRSPQNDNLWQGVNGINNPCPAGYRLPTVAEWNAELSSWSSRNTAGAFGSPLKLTLAGRRVGSSGLINDVDTHGDYWSSTVSGIRAWSPYIVSGGAGMFSGSRAVGRTVRCLKDDETPEPDTYTLSLVVNPPQGGTVSGAGVYVENAEVIIAATASEGYVFVSWSGDTVYIADESADSTLVSMPAMNITLTANFEQLEDGDWPRDTETEMVEVTSVTGRVWMDRNLGASRAATSSTDSEAYGDLYQWGRAADGHQRRNSETASTLSSSDQPGHGSFITGNSGANWDWRSPRNDNLWQGVNGVNNPCPAGYRLPTEAEWNAERISWGSITAAGAFASPLQLPMAGYRGFTSGSLDAVGSRGDYWSGTVSGGYARALYFYSDDYSEAATMGSNFRAYGASVRCLKD